MLMINCSVMPDSVHPMDWSLPGFVFHGIFQTRILEWVSISYSKGSSWASDCLLQFLHWQVDPLPLHHLRSTEGTYFNIIKWVQASQVGASRKEPACQCRRHRRSGFNPWVWKIPWSRKWKPTPIFLPGNFHGKRSLVGCKVHEAAKSRT